MSNPRKTLWLECPELHQYSSTCMWDLKMHWANYVREKYSFINKSCLSIGCGSGELERGLIKNGCATTMDAFDINQDSLINAKKLAEFEGYSINNFIGDTNTIKLKENKYDFVVAHNSLHHVNNLEHIMQEISNSLKHNGLLIMVEFTGPTRFQWTDKQLIIINKILEILPEKFKRIEPTGKIIKKIVSRDTMTGYLNSNPSEAIRSAEIIPIASKYFEILEERNMGGTILHMLLNDIIDNFDETREEDRVILKFLCYLEKGMIENGELSSDEKLVIFKKSIKITIKK